MDIKLVPDKYKGSQGVTGAKIDALKSDLDRFSGRFVKKADSWLVWLIILLTSIVLICFSLWGYKLKLVRDTEILTQGIEELQGERDVDLENNFIALKTGIENLKEILSNRIYPSQVFVMLEETTLPYVRFTRLNADLEQSLMSLSIEAVNYSTLAKQVYIFEEDWRITEVELSEVHLEGSGRVSSELLLKLNPALLRSQE